MVKLKYVITCVFLVLMCVLLFSCGNGEGNKPSDSSFEPADNVEVSVIADQVVSALSNGSNISSADLDYIGYMMDTDFAMFADYDFRSQISGTIIDEFGIIKAKDEMSLPIVQQLISDYFDKRNEAWMPEYLPEEYPKLLNASQKTVGLYVIYTILSEEDTLAAFSAFENALKAS